MRLWQTERPSCDVCARVKEEGSAEGYHQNKNPHNLVYNYNTLLSPQQHTTTDMSASLDADRTHDSFNAFLRAVKVSDPSQKLFRSLLSLSPRMPRAATQQVNCHTRHL